MRKIVFTFSILSSFLSLAIANEEAHSAPSVLDLKYPIINFIILLMILSKVIKPLREKFKKENGEVKSLMESADKNHKDAEARLTLFKNKFSELDSELIKITTDYDTDAAQFAKNQSNETQTIIARMKRDLENKLEGEKKELLDALEHDLLNEVIAKAQSAISSNKNLKAQATNKIITEIR